MNTHDAYGKEILRAAFPEATASGRPAITAPFQCGGSVNIDAVLYEDIAVEIESRTSKQVRGALMDLILHPAPKKLLLLLPVHMANAELCARQADEILERFIPRASSRVVVLLPMNSPGAFEQNTLMVRDAVTALRAD